MASSRCWAWSEEAPWVLASLVISLCSREPSQMRRATARTRSRDVSPVTGASARCSPWRLTIAVTNCSRLPTCQ